MIWGFPPLWPSVSTSPITLQPHPGPPSILHTHQADSCSRPFGFCRPVPSPDMFLRKIFPRTAPSCHLGLNRSTSLQRCLSWLPVQKQSSISWHCILVLFICRAPIIDSFLFIYLLVFVQNLGDENFLTIHHRSLMSIQCPPQYLAQGRLSINSYWMNGWTDE